MNDNSPKSVLAKILVEFSSQMYPLMMKSEQALNFFQKFQRFLAFQNKEDVIANLIFYTFSCLIHKNLS